LSPNEAYTNGSRSIEVSGAAVRAAAAEVRAILIGLAADELAVDSNKLHLHLFIFRKTKFPAIFTVSQLSPTVSTNCHLLGKSPPIGRVSRLSKEKYM